MISYTAQDEGINPLNKDREYYFKFFCKCMHGFSYVFLDVPSCKGRDVPEKLRELRREYPDYAVTAVPMKTFEEQFIEDHGIGVH